MGRDIWQKNCQSLGTFYCEVYAHFPMTIQLSDSKKGDPELILYSFLYHFSCKKVEQSDECCIDSVKVNLQKTA